MTPAVDLLKRMKCDFHLHSYYHDPSADSYGEEAAQKLGVAANRVFKTLVVELDGERLAVGVVPVRGNLNLKALAKVLGAKKAVMAQPQKAERATGYLLGGVSPLAQKRMLETVVDASACEHGTIFISAGRRGLEIELEADVLIALLGAETADIAI